jgi:hypothetical protein
MKVLVQRKMQFRTENAALLDFSPLKSGFSPLKRGPFPSENPGFSLEKRGFPL